MTATSRAILITGATGAIGGALARAYAAPGVHLVLHGRQEAVLEELTLQCEGAGASVEASSVPLENDQARDHWLNTLDSRYPLDLVIASAGANSHPIGVGQLEDRHASSQLLELNLRIPICMTQTLAPRMVARGRGQLVLISSLAAWYGLPLTPTYSASKAGIKAYGEGLRGHLADQGVGITVVMPGYVSSAMCDAMPGPKPLLWSAERAARHIQRRLVRNPARISFPFPLNAGCWLLGALPAEISQRLVRYLGYTLPAQHHPDGR